MISVPYKTGVDKKRKGLNPVVSSSNKVSFLLSDVGPFLNLFTSGNEVPANKGFDVVISLSLLLRTSYLA